MEGSPEHSVVAYSASVIARGYKIVISYRGHKTEMFFVPRGEAATRFEINRGFIWAERTNVTLPTDRLICRGGQL